MGRREFITLVGAAAVAWPLKVQAQQPAMPVIGFLSAVSPGPFVQRVAAFHQGLNEAGYVEGRNVAIENRWAEGQYDRLPALAADLVGRQVVVIVTYTDAAALAAKAATTTIPIVFINGGDPVRAGIVPSLNRPGANVTGVSFFGVDLAPKQLALLHEVVPNAAVIAVLVDQNVPDAVAQVPAMQEAARTLGLQLVVLLARTASDIDTAFATFVARASRCTRRRHGCFADQPAQTNHRTGGAPCAARDLPVSRVCRGWRLDQLRQQRSGYLSPGWRLCRADSQGRQAGRSAGHTVHQIRIRAQPQDRQGAGLTIPPSLLASADEVIE